MKIAVISANLGRYDPDVPWVPQIVPAGVTVEVHRLTDATFPPRPKAMTSALQCGIPKWFGADLFPGADVYLWVDASCALLNSHAVTLLLERLGTSNLLVFRHPDRATIGEEYEFLKTRLARPGERYLTTRYAGEWLDAQYEHICARHASFVDYQLFATTAFMYRPDPSVLAVFKETWFGKTRWHLHDQLFFAYALAKSDCNFRVLQEKYTDCPYLTFVRNRHRKSA